MSENTFRLGPQLAKLHKAVVFQLYGKMIEPLLIASKLMDAENQPLYPMTEEGLNLLLNTIITSTAVALSKAKIQIPAGYAPDEIELADNMMKSFGVAALTVNETDNNLTLSFDGVGALVQSLDLPLRIDEAMSLRIDNGEDVIQIQIGKKPIITGQGLIEEPLLANPSLSLRQ